MYTSCGWFFDEISGLEAAQILRYAARAIGLIRELTGLNFEIEFSRLLEKAPSNVPELVNGKRVYELLVKPSQVSLERLAAHYGLSVLFFDQASDYWKELSGGCWDVAGENISHETAPEIAGSKAFAAGKVSVSSRITMEKKDFTFAANYRGGTAVVCGIIQPEHGYAGSIFANLGSLRDIFATSDKKKLIEMFGHNFFSLRHILNYAQRAMVNKLLELDTSRVEKGLRDVVSNYYGIFEYLATLNVKAPPIINSVAGIDLTYSVANILKDDAPDLSSLRAYMSRSRQWNIALNTEHIENALRAWLTKQMRGMYKSPANAARTELVKDVIVFFTSEFPMRLDLYEAQNYYYATQIQITRGSWQLSPDARTAFKKLGSVLKFAEEALEMGIIDV